MLRNEGTFDRGLRAVVGLALIALVLLAQIANPVLYWGAVVVGAVMLFTAVTGFCPAYRLLGLMNCRDC